MKIALDVMGGDFAPEQAFKGVQLFFDENKDQSIHLLLIGTADAMNKHADDMKPYEGRYTFIEAPQVIGMDEHPTKALKEKQQSSIAIGFGLLQAKKADAFISAGNTGAMMVGAMYTVKNIPGVQRPTIASPIPRGGGRFNLLLDVGINADCKAENLVQFALLGSMYMKHVQGIESPRVGLLNIGEEEGKGVDAVRGRAGLPVQVEISGGYELPGPPVRRSIMRDRFERTRQIPAGHHRVTLTQPPPIVVRHHGLGLRS